MFRTLLKLPVVVWLKREYPLPPWVGLVFLVAIALMSAGFETAGWLLAGFFFLISSADWLVEAAEKVGRALNISQLTIGLTIVAFGTSAPELIVNFIAAVKGHAGITIGDILGSNIVNICLGIGISAVLVGVTIRRSTAHVELPFLAGGTLLLFLVVFDFSAPVEGLHVLSRTGGIALLAGFAAYLGYVYWCQIRTRRAEVSDETPEERHIRREALPRSIVKLLISVVLLYFSGEIIVGRSVLLAQSFGIKQSIIGATIVAIGTSVPDVTASVLAAMKGKHDIAVGNIVGSNTFNTLWVLGVSAVVAPASLPFSDGLFVDFTIMSVLTLFFFLVALARKKVVRYDGIVMVLAYVGYMVFLFSTAGTGGGH